MVKTKSKKGGCKKRKIRANNLLRSFKDFKLNEHKLTPAVNHDSMPTFWLNYFYIVSTASTAKLKSNTSTINITFSGGEDMNQSNTSGTFMPVKEKMFKTISNFNQAAPMYPDQSKTGSLRPISSSGINEPNSGEKAVKRKPSRSKTSK